MWKERRHKQEGETGGGVEGEMMGQSGRAAERPSVAPILDSADALQTYSQARGLQANTKECDCFSPLLPSPSLTSSFGLRLRNPRQRLIAECKGFSWANELSTGAGTLSCTL
ncbi:hypothetical protein EYF80_031742 [Liparis tanakae]|uniref:Uncharacterized protein n=1 Tax=Liparis tanakae TaxID=230148 RepID=A0A4Z2GXT5_9TELE|nr:hypothetical protein EYF80_031742 [Liparis tanakae]